MRKTSVAPLALSLLLGLAGCQSPPPTSPAAIGELRAGSGQLNGYLPRAQLPDSLALLPPPPAAGSALAAADLDIYRATRALRDTPRGAQAARDAPYKWPGVGDVFSCALGVPVSEAGTPHLYTLLRRTLVDAGLATYRAKDHHVRQRPYVATAEATCLPAEEAALRNDGSYPSGHAAFGWAWALVLAELAPERGGAILRRGLEFGQSRVVCGYHWQSDVDAGRLVGAATVARLQADPVFRAQAALARQEIATARAAGAQPPAHCAAEAAALVRP